MLTDFSLWLIYFSSYLLDYFLILGILVCKKWKMHVEKKNLFWNGTDIAAWGILIVLIAISVIVIVRIRKLEMNERVKFFPDKNITIEMLGYIVAQIITVASTILTKWWIPIDLIIFVLTGVIFVRSKAVHHSPLFVFPLRNKIYSSGNKIIITNYSLEEMRMAQEDSEDGLEARQLTKGIYYIRKK